MKLILLLFMIGWLLPANAANLPPQKPNLPDGVSAINPGNDLWREVRQRDMQSVGTSQVKQVDSGVLINPYGDKWARFRAERLASYSGFAIAGVFVVLVVFYLWRGRIGVEGGLSGDKVFRYSGYERIVHWTLAVVFLFLAVTGLILLLGRPLLIPLLGKSAFGTIAWLSKEGHNLIGPLFLVSLLMMLISFARRNLYEKGDLTWLMKGGGLIGGEHVPSGFFNMGEKSWYWMVILIGLVISASGLILLLPVLGYSRVVMEVSHIVHVIGSMILILVSFGHIYIGSIGSEGALDGMTTGYVDINWAESHHDRWARKCREEGRVVAAGDIEEADGKTGAGPSPQAGR